MLLTRCPECDTTFRVTDETLKKASGQVRCGRCATVFNAYAELHDPAAKSLQAEPAAAGPEPRAQAADGAAIGSVTVAAVVAEAKVAEADANAVPAPPADAHAISATEVDRVLNVDPPVADNAYVWALDDDKPQALRSRWWAAAAALALVTLLAQGIHHFRADIAGHATFGPWLVAAYEALGSEIKPRWDVRQYEILDWVATAEPNARGLGSLKITARIQNHGPLRQPYPAVQLRLKDRWESALGSRMFTPAEYLPRDTPRERLMSPGETTRAEIEVVDPGPDAYGFELDVCIEVEASLITCGADAVFR